MSLVTEEIKAKAEFFEGAEACKESVKLLLAEVGLPNGLLPLDNIEECGRVKETGFVWFKRQVKKEHYFESIGRLICYAPEVTGYAEKNRIKKMTGVKSKEFGIWITVNEVYVNDPPTGKIIFKAPAGLSKSFPVSAFEIKEEDHDDEAKEDKTVPVVAEEQLVMN